MKIASPSKSNSAKSFSFICGLKFKPQGFALSFKTFFAVLKTRTRGLAVRIMASPYFAAPQAVMSMFVAHFIYSLLRQITILDDR